MDGWLNYYAVPTSYPYLQRFVLRLKRMWLFILRRRSQMDRFKWASIAKLTARHWPKLEIRHRGRTNDLPSACPQRDPREEPDALAGSSGSVRGALGNQRPYRNRRG